MNSSTITHTQHAEIESGSQIQLALLFYVGWPALLGVILGWTGAGALGGELPKYLAVPYWVLGFLLMRLSLEASTRTIAWIAPKGKKIPLALLCLLAIPLHVYISAPLTYLWQVSFLGLLPEATATPPSGIFITTIEKYVGGLRSSVVIALEWVLINLTFDRIMNFPRFREITGYEPPQPIAPPVESAADLSSDPPPAEDLSASDSRFLKKIPKKLGIDITAMSAEDHYVRVYTSLGNDLVLYRFSDAMAEMPKETGFQVHRSHWVRKSAITGFQKRNNGQVLILKGEIEVPVSKRFIEVVKTNGLEMTDSTST